MKKKPAYNRKHHSLNKAVCYDLSWVKAAICDVAASVAEVIANQSNQRGHIISLTYAAESWAALRASVAGTYISLALSP